MLSLLGVARLLYPQPERMQAQGPEISSGKIPRKFWIYLAGAAFVGAGFVDYPLVAFHFHKANTVSASWVPIFYAVAMGVSGAGSLVFGRLFDQRGIGILIPLTLLAALVAPLVFLGSFWPALTGVAIWGLAMGAHESIMPAAVAPMVAREKRASAYGLFTAVTEFLGFWGARSSGSSTIFPSA